VPPARHLTIDGRAYVRAESDGERRSRHWLAGRSFYAECMTTRGGVVRVRDIVGDLKDCEDPMEPELCERLQCGPGSSYAAGARRVLNAHFVLFSPHGGDVELAFRDAEARVLSRVEFPAEL
jgi:hypothetical protein